MKTAGAGKRCAKKQRTKKRNGKVAVCHRRARKIYTLSPMEMAELAEANSRYAWTVEMDDFYSQYIESHRLQVGKMLSEWLGTSIELNDDGAHGGESKQIADSKVARLEEDINSKYNEFMRKTYAHIDTEAITDTEEEDSSPDDDDDDAAARVIDCVRMILDA